MKRTQVSALLSDYDGTLCSTASVRGNGNDGGTTPEEIDRRIE